MSHRPQRAKCKFLNLYSNASPHLGEIAVYDLSAKKWTFNPRVLTLDHDMVNDLEAFGLHDCFFYNSNFKRLNEANFQRNRDGEIVLRDRPIKMTIEDGIALAITPVPAPATKATEVQLANLAKGGLNERNRYIPRVRKFPPALLALAREKRQADMTWKQIARDLKVNSDSLQRTMRKQVAH